MRAALTVHSAPARVRPYFSAQPAAASPFHDGEECTEQRENVLWRLDHNAALRFSHENPDVQALYTEYLSKPLSERSHHLLHTDIDAWQMPQES